MLPYKKYLLSFLLIVPVLQIWAQCKDSQFEVVAIKGGTARNINGEVLKKGSIVYSTDIEKYRFEPAHSVSITLYSKNCGKICLIRPNATQNGFDKYFGWVKNMLGWDSEEQIAGSKGEWCEREMKRLQQIFLVPDENGLADSRYITLPGKKMVAVDTACFPISDKSFFAFEYTWKNKEYKIRIPHERNILQINFSGMEGLMLTEPGQQSNISVQWNYYDFKERKVVHMATFIPYILADSSLMPAMRQDQH